VPLELRDFMKVSKVIAVELLDEILGLKFGIHFLEPIVVERVVKKIVPAIISRRKTSVQSPIRLSTTPELRGK
jgi:hypothetical protein